MSAGYPLAVLLDVRKQAQEVAERVLAEQVRDEAAARGALDAATRARDALERELAEACDGDRARTTFTIDDGLHLEAERRAQRERIAAARHVESEREAALLEAAGRVTEARAALTTARTEHEAVLRHEAEHRRREARAAETRAEDDLDERSAFAHGPRPR